MLKVFSGLVGLGLILSAAAAAGQAPPDKAKTAQKPKLSELDTAIAASANHPDVRLAQAKLLMAQAELEQAKMLVAQRIAATHAKVQAAKVQFEIEQQGYQRLRPLLQQGTIPQTEMLAAERSLAQAKAALAAAEAEWQAARGQPPGKAAATKTGEVLSRLLLDDFAGQQREQLSRSYLDVVRLSVAPAPGSAADKLRGLIDKRVKLDNMQGVKFPVAIDALRSAAGSDLMIRVPENWTRLKAETLTLTGSELPFIAWLDLILDDFNDKFPNEDRLGVYVREYGLLLTTPRFAPPGALTLAEFARQVQPRKDAAPKAEPKR